MVTPKKFVRRPFSVRAVQVTAELMEEIAKWCGGEIKEAKNPHDDTDVSKYIHVRVVRPVNERQTRAFVGDWILSATTGFKVFTDAAFKKTFEPETPKLRSECDHSSEHAKNPTLNPKFDPKFVEYQYPNPDNDNQWVMSYQAQD
jgi:hypothetical protein